MWMYVIFGRLFPVRELDREEWGVKDSGLKMVWFIDERELLGTNRK